MRRVTYREALIGIICLTFGSLMGYTRGEINGWGGIVSFSCLLIFFFLAIFLVLRFMR